MNVRLEPILLLLVHFYQAQPQSVTALWPVPDYGRRSTHTGFLCVNKLLTVVT